MHVISFYDLGVYSFFTELLTKILKTFNLVIIINSIHFPHKTVTNIKKIMGIVICMEICTWGIPFFTETCVIEINVP